jgi:septal ring factor EnvC (AmiA/AmiB activator)
VLAALGLPAPGAAAADDGRLEQKKAELQELRQAAQEAAERLNRTRSKKESARQAVFALEEDIAELRRRRRENREALAATAERLEDLAGRRDDLRTRIADHRERLGAYLRAAYRSGRHGYLRQLFGHEDPHQVRRAVTYLRYLHRARQQAVTRLRADREKLARVMGDLREQRDKRRRLQAELAEQKERIQARRDERQELVAKLAARARRQQERLSEIRADQKALKEVIDRLGRLRERGILLEIDDKHMAELKGELPLPVADPEMLARFGAPRQGKSLRWQGLLLGAEPGTEVHTIFRGRVAYADRLRGYGLVLIVDHGDGLLSLYAHNRVLFKEVGEWVETGEVVAAVGATGGRSQPATYFEVRRGGTPVDPLAWCRRPRG